MTNENYAQTPWVNGCKKNTPQLNHEKQLKNLRFSSCFGIGVKVAEHHGKHAISRGASE